MTAPINRAVLGLQFVCLFGGAAHAGRPLVAEDADFLAPQACEWESVAARARMPGSPSVRSLQTQLACGVGFNSQVAVAVLQQRFDGQSSNSVLVGSKTALIPRQDAALGVALAWGVVGVRAPGGGLTHELSVLNGVLSKQLLAGWTGHVNVGWVHSQAAAQHTTTWDIGLEYVARPGLDLMAEVYGDDRLKPWLGLGVRWAASPDWSLNAAYNRQSSTPSVSVWSVGAKFAF